MYQLFVEGKPLMAYIDGGKEGIRKKIQRLYDRIGAYPVPDVEKINTKRILLFSEHWCPDCLVLLAALKYLSEKIAGLNIRSLPRDPYTDILAEYSRDGKARIPLALFYDHEWNELGFLSELPEPIQERILAHPEFHKEYRKGTLMQELVGELLKIMGQQ